MTARAQAEHFKRELEAREEAWREHAIALSNDIKRERAAAERLLHGWYTLFDAIAHGDDEHRAWLKKAIDDHFTGEME